MQVNCKTAITYVLRLFSNLFIFASMCNHTFCKLRFLCQGGQTVASRQFDLKHTYINQGIGTWVDGYMGGYFYRIGIQVDNAKFFSFIILNTAEEAWSLHLSLARQIQNISLHTILCCTALMDYFRYKHWLLASLLLSPSNTLVITQVLLKGLDNRFCNSPLHPPTPLIVIVHLYSTCIGEIP